MADTKDIALLLAEGETAKAKTLKTWLDVEPAAGPLEARVVLWRTYFAHMAAAARYLELAKGDAGVAAAPAPFRFADAPKPLQDALLAYHARPCDAEAGELVRAVLAAHGVKVEGGSDAPR